jgi:hypothetical protein
MFPGVRVNPHFAVGIGTINLSTLTLADAVHSFAYVRYSM